MAGTSLSGLKRVVGAVGRLVFGLTLATALAIWPGLIDGARAGGARGQLVVSVAGGRQSAGQVCITLRDLTEQMVVGSYCDGDDTDRDPRRGRIVLDLPRRSFAIDARVPGGTVERVSPRHFELGRRQIVVVRLGS